MCNVFIDSDFKFELFQETFPRVYDISDNWLINIRGKKREHVMRYIQTSFANSKEHCTFFSNLYDDDWAKSTREMLKDSKYDYIYIFLEDHFLMKPLTYFQHVISDMIKNHIDYFQYSFFNVGLHTKSIEKKYPEFTKYFSFFSLGSSELAGMKKDYPHFYPYSLVSVASKKYFLRILEIEDKVLLSVPAFFQAIMSEVFFSYPRNRSFWFFVNRFFYLLGYRFVIYSPATPFNLEKSLFDCNETLFPLTIGVLQEELFANLDDDNVMHNSSLIKRGLYPSDFVQTQAGTAPTDSKKYHLLRGERVQSQYYPNKPRLHHVPLKYVFVEKGVLDITSSRGSISLQHGQSVWVAANIPHTIIAQQDCWYSIHITDI